MWRRWLIASNNSWPVKFNCFSYFKGESSKVALCVRCVIESKTHPPHSRSKVITLVTQTVQTLHRCVCCAGVETFGISGKTRRNLL